MERITVDLVFGWLVPKYKGYNYRKFSKEFCNFLFKRAGSIFGKNYQCRKHKRTVLIIFESTPNISIGD